MNPINEDACIARGYRDDDGHPVAYESEYYGGPRRLVRTRGHVATRSKASKQAAEWQSGFVKRALIERQLPKTRGIN